MDSALIGCGFIGGLIAEHVASGRLPIRLRLLLDRHEDKVKRIQDLFKEPPGAAHAIEDIISSNVDLVVEAASIGAVQSFAEPILSSGKDMMIMSVGAFSDTRFYKRVEELCMEKDVKVYLPSGAIGALDAVSSASEGRLREVELSTIKNPVSLKGAPYVIKHGIDLSEIKKPTVIFQGNAAEAIEGFPANVNVAVTLSLAGMGVGKTRVRIIADPSAKRNIHEVRAKGDFGELFFRTENIPSPDNPRTSVLAALSAISTLKKITRPVKIG